MREAAKEHGLPDYFVERELKDCDLRHIKDGGTLGSFVQIPSAEIPRLKREMKLVFDGAIPSPWLIEAGWRYSKIVCNGTN